MGLASGDHGLEVQLRQTASTSTLLRPPWMHPAWCLHPAMDTAADYRRDLLQLQVHAGGDTDIAPNELRFGPTSPLFSLSLSPSIRVRDS
jgi:hypothetical protein